LVSVSVYSYSSAIIIRPSFSIISKRGLVTSLNNPLLGISNINSLGSGFNFNLLSCSIIPKDEVYIRSMIVSIFIVDHIYFLFKGDYKACASTNSLVNIIFYIFDINLYVEGILEWYNMNNKVSAMSYWLH